MQTDPPYSDQALTGDELVSSFGLLFEATLTLRRRLMRDIEASGLRGEFFDVLVRLMRTPGNRLPMTHLASELDYTAGGMTRLADRMEGEGLLIRVHDDQDRRYVFAALTDAGRSRFEQLWPGHVQTLRVLLEDVLGPAGVRRLSDDVRTLRDAV